LADINIETTGHALSCIGIYKYRHTPLTYTHPIRSIRDV